VGLKSWSWAPQLERKRRLWGLGHLGAFCFASPHYLLILRIWKCYRKCPSIFKWTLTIHTSADLSLRLWPDAYGAVKRGVCDLESGDVTKVTGDSGNGKMARQNPHLPTSGKCGPPVQVSAEKSGANLGHPANN